MVHKEQHPALLLKESKKCPKKQTLIFFPESPRGAQNLTFQPSTHKLWPRQVLFDLHDAFKKCELVGKM